MKKFVPYLLLVPSLILVVVFKIYPLMMSFMGSFSVDNSFSLKNYALIFQDSAFWTSFGITILFSLIITPLQVIIALAMALLVNVKLRGITVFRTLLYLPVVVSLTVASMLWGIMMDPNSGIVNSLLKFVNIPAQPLLTSSSEALLCIIVISSWKGIGYWMMFYLAGLQGISPEVYEASRIDGANWWQTVSKITIPLLNKVTVFVVVSDTVANMLLFVPMYILTNGGPNNSTDVLMFEAYKSAFTYSDMGRSYAIVTILIILISIVIGTQFKLLQRRDY